MRREKDSLGELDVPDDAYYGIQTVRCAGNYAVGSRTYNRYPEVIQAMACIKKACAMTNCQIGALSAEKAEAIIQAADEMIAGRFKDQFPVNVWRSQGTGVNMNVNEVLANRANEILTGHKGYDAVHPNSHVNMCQSSNDTFPTAEVIVFRRLIKPLIDAVKGLEDALGERALDFEDTIRLGRTGFQDAVPMTWGQIFGGWQSSVRRQRLVLEKLHAGLNHVVLGATAVGTGMGQLPGYAERIYTNLSHVLGYEIFLVRMEGECIEDSAVFDGMRNTDEHVVIAGCVKNAVAAAARIAQDILLFASGPRAGIGELTLTSGCEDDNARACESVLDALGEMQASEGMAFYSCLEGQLDHGSQNSAGFIGVIDAIKLATRVLQIFTETSVRRVSVNEELCRRKAEESTSLSTMVSSLFGYPVGSKIAKLAISKNISCKQAALQENILPADVCEDLFDVKKLTSRKAMVEMFKRYRNLRKIS